VAENGREAVERVLEGRFDLVLMDCEMPEMDGYEATDRIRRIEREQQRRAVPIVALTAHAMPGDQRRCLECGMNEVVTKPVALETFGRLLERWTSPAPGR